MASDPFAVSASTAAHTNADTDSTAEAIHHTLGRGVTQAAPGNHKHKYADLSDTPDGAVPPDMSNYVAKTGDQVMTGVLQINNANGLQLHYSGDSVLSLVTRLDSGAYTLNVLAGWALDSLSPVRLGAPITGEHAARADWVDANYAGIDRPNVLISGPHGPLDGYETINAVVPGVTPYSTQLHHTSEYPGWTLITVSGYLQIRNVVAYSQPSLSAYLTPYGRWHDDIPVNWKNGSQKSIARFTVVKPVDYGYAGVTTQAWFENRPGMRGSFGAQGAVGAGYDSGAYAAMGALRITLEVHPYASTPDDAPSWGIP